MRTSTNGIWFGGPPPNHSYFYLRLRTVSTTPEFDGHTLDTSLVLYVTGAALPTPAERADFLFIQNYPAISSMHVLEASDGANTGTFNVYGKIGSLIPTSIQFVSGGGFPSSQGVSVPAPPVLAEVPELSTGILCTAALAILFGGRRLLSRLHTRRYFNPL